MIKLKNKSLLADLGLTLVAIIWGIGFPVTQIALTNGFSPFSLLTFRFLVAGVITTFIIFLKKYKFTKKNIFSGLIIGLFLFIGFATQTIGMLYTSPSKTGFLTAVNVIIVPFLYWALTKKKPDNFTFAATFICLVGIGFLSLTDSFSLEFGDILILICAFGFAAHITATGFFSGTENPLVLTCIQMWCAAILSFIFMNIYENFPSLTYKGIGAGFYLSVISTTFAFFLQTICQKFTSTTKVAIILSTEALFGTLFSIIILNDALTWKIIIGGIAIFSSVIIAETKLNFLIKK